MIVLKDTKDELHGCANDCDNFRWAIIIITLVFLAAVGTLAGAAATYL